MLLILPIIFLVLVFGGGGSYYGYRRWGTGGGIGVGGTTDATGIAPAKRHEIHRDPRRRRTMKARFLTTAVLAIGIFATSGALRAQQGSITFTFGDRDRQAMREWYRDHYNAQEFQSQRRWNGQWEQRLQAGVVLEPQLRGWVRPVPRDLYGRLSPLPQGYRYVIVSDHVVVVDDGWMIHDVNHFERFENPDQQVTRDWYRDHRDDGAFEGRRHWNDRFEQRIQVGATLDPDLRRMSRPVPVDLLGQLPRRPRGMRYVMIGDHACLVDRWWTVRYVMHLEQQ